MPAEEIVKWMLVGALGFAVAVIGAVAGVIIGVIVREGIDHWRGE